MEVTFELQQTNKQTNKFHGADFFLRSWY